MTKGDVSEAAICLEALIEAAAQDELVIILGDGRPAAQLVPAGAIHQGLLEERKSENPFKDGLHRSMRDKQIE